ncbi:MAG: serine/threonine protein kinase, partial [Pseudonocardia sp.]|nr:serine/threonine protein kinase [Pseudonocardia sp.]
SGGPARPASYLGPARPAWPAGAARPASYLGAVRPVLSRLPRALSRLPPDWRAEAKRTSDACWAGLRDRCWPALRDWAAPWLASSPDRMRARLAAASHPVIGLPRVDRPLATASGPPPRRPRLPVTLVAPPGGLMGRFELVHQIGTGGFGGVWLATDRALGRRVAVKAAHAPDHETELRIRREANALGAVRHPHCVRILDLVDSRGEPGLAPLHGLVIVMEYVDGRSLGEIVAAHGPIDDTMVARIWLRMAEALIAAHQRGVLHRDVKPGNVLLDARGEPHLIDFGIARARGDATLTQHGMIVGTPDFLAPEVARGERATPASDGWQLAATISFALTGWPPRGDHPDAVSGLRAAAGSAAPTCLPRHSVHRRLLEACLAADPAARPTLPSVRDMLHNWLLPTSGAPRVGPLTAALGRTGTD